MNRAIWGILCLCLLTAGTARNASAQANVNENLETNFLYVDTVNGNDSNLCTQVLPCATISKAVSVAAPLDGTTGSRIIVNPGTYRESITFSNPHANYLPITVEAATNGTVTVSGADVWTGWQPYSGNPQIYTNPWPYDWGLCPMEVGDGAPYQTQLELRREMVFMNGTPLTQVLSLSDMVYPDMFFVDETNDVIYVWPPSGVDIDTATVEVSTRDPLLTVMGWNGLVIRGITFQYANSCHNGHAVFVEGNSSNILFDTDTFQWNNAKGVNLQDPTSNVTVENSNGPHNGQDGFLDFQGLNVEYTNDTANYNNWRGAEGAFYSWGMGGFYFDQDHYATVSNLTAMYTEGNGFHWDTDNIQSTATNILAAGNMLNGIFYEKDLGPLTLTNSTIADNMYVPEITNFTGGGILFRNSENLTLTNNNIFGNGNSQMFVTGQAGGIVVTDWQTNQTYNLITSYLTFQQDVMESTTETPYVFEDPFLSGADWTGFYTTLNSGQNTWWNAANSNAYDEPTGTGLNPGVVGNFAMWQATTGQDLDSVFQAPVPDPAQNFTLPPPDYPDYWLAVDNFGVEQVAADGTAVFNISTIPVGSYTGNVSLLLDGVSEAPGLSGSLSTNSISIPGTAQVSLSSLPTIAPGYYPITVVSNSGGTGNATKVVQFNVLIPTSSIRIVPATLNFPPTQVNYISAPLTMTATNYGTTPITIASIVPPAPFTESDNCHGLIPAGGSCTLTIIFAPTAAFTFSEIMDVTDSDPTSPQIITLNGTALPAPQVSLSSTALVYGFVPVGQNAVMTTVLTNTGAGALVISSVAIGGTNAGDFTQSNTCGTTVQPGGTCTFTVMFAPGGVNQRSGSLTISDNVTSGATQMVSLSGTGTQPNVQLPASLSFNSVVIGSSMSNNLTLTNGGNGTLNISGITISGVNAGDFTQSNTCGTQVLPYTSCTITVTYTPTVLGAESASLLITDNAPNSPQSVPLTGTGTAPALNFSPNPAAFANQTVNTTSSGLPITITNSGTATVTIISVTITGTNASNFTISQPCVQTVITAGNSCTATLKFTPNSMGAFSAFLTVTSNAPGSPANIPLTGTGIQAIVSLSPTSLSFGNQLLNTTSPAQNVTLTNTGNTALSITSIAIGGSNTNWFAESNTCGTSLAAGASCTITATFTPLQSGPASPSINLTDNGTGSPQSIPLSGTGVIPTATLSPASLFFGNVQLGTSSTTQTVTVSNTGTAALSIASITITGADPADYAQTNTCGSNLNANATCTVTVVFTPAATGSRTANVTLTDNAMNSPQNVSLTGTGVQATVSITPGSLSFGSEYVGTKSTGQVVTLKNTGSETLTISSVGFTGTNAADFSDTLTCNTSLGIGQSCTVTVYYDPSIVGAESANLTFTTNAPDSPENVALTGTGLLGSIAPNPATLSFGSQNLNTSSAPQTSTITNTGTTTITFTSIKLTGGNSTWFSETNTCGTSLAAGASCTVTVTFTPLATGTAAPSVTIIDNANPTTQAIALNGTGVSEGTGTLSPVSLNFGNVNLGTTSSAMTATLMNSGTAVLTLTSIVITGANPADYAETNTCGTSLAVGASCTVTVTFTPPVTGSQTANVTFTDNATNSPQNLSLTGTGVQATVSISPGSLNFGSENVGTKTSGQAVTLMNTGNEALTISSVGFTGTNAGDFSDTNTCGSSLGVGASCTVTVYYDPSIVGAESANLTFTTNAPNSPENVALTGTGVQGGINPNPSSLSFGSQNLNTSSAPQISTITNTGTATLTFTSITITGTDSTWFSETNTCGTSLAVGASCTITVTFTPLSTGTATPTLTITDNANPTTQTITLSGTGVSATAALAPATLNFGNVNVGTTSSSQTATLTNTGTTALTMSSIAITGANPGDYSETNTCGTSLAIGATCTVTVTFTPPVTGSQTANVTFTDSATNSPQNLSLTGTGIQATVTFLPGTLSFGSENVGTKSTGQVVTVTNTGSETLTISSVGFTGTNAGDFSDTNTCGSSLGVGASCTVTVYYDPSIVGAESANLTFTTNAPDSPENVSLSGTGVQASVNLNPSSLSFGSQNLNTSSAPQTSTITNTGTATITFTSITLTGTDSTWFNETNTCGTSLAVGASCTITVTFTPLSTGTATPTVTITDNANPTTQTIALSGTGVSPTAGLVPTLLNFGNVNLGTTSSAMTVTLTNSGTAVLTMSSIAITGTNPGDYSETNTCGTSLAIGASCTVTVTFTPPVTGSLTANVTFTDNATNSPQNVSLTGTGVQATVSISPGSLSFGSENVGTKTSGQAVTLTNTGNEALTISSVGFTGTNAGDFSDTNTCGSSLGVGASCTVTVYYDPSIVGAESANLTFTTNAPNSPENVSLTGTGIQATIDPSPSSLSFGNQEENTSSAPQISTITNTGTATLTFTSIKLTGTDSTWFSETNTCGTSLAVGASCTITVTFTPLSTGTATPTLTITDNANPTTQTITLSGTGVSATAALAPATLNFGNVNVGTTSSSQTATLTNTGTTALTMSSIAITGANPGDYSETNTCGTSLAIGATCTVTVTFTPPVTGSQTANVTFTDSATNSPQNLSLTGTGIQATVTFLPGTLSFGSENVGTKSTGQVVTVTNTGSETLTISSVAFTGTNAGDFSDTNTCGATLGVGRTCTVTVYYDPSIVGAESANLTFTTNAPNSPENVSLTGTGIQATIDPSPSSLSFGNQEENTSSAPQISTITNTGTATLTFTSIKLTGTDSTWFSETNTCGTSLAVGASCTITVTFTPLSTGTATPTVTITDNANPTTQTITLSGAGVSASVVLAPTSLNFGNVSLGTSSSPLTGTLTNSGTGTLTLSSIGITGTNPGDFSETNTCGTSLAAGASCTITVTFTPTSATARSANVTFTDNATNSPQNLTLKGTGTDVIVSLTPSSLTFSAENVGSKSAGMTVTLKNTGNATLTISSIILGGANAGDFSDTSKCGTTLAAGKTCTVTVYFDPTQTGTRTGTLTFTTNAPNSPETVSLTGTGTQPLVMLTPTTVNFGSVPINTTSAPVAVTLQNVGTGSLTINSMTFTGTNASWFAQTNACGTTVAPGGSCTINITVTPKSKITGSASLSVKDTAPASPQTVSLTATGS